MGRLATADFAIAEELSRELATIQLDGNGKLDAVLPRLRAFLELETLIVFCPQEHLHGWGVERLETDNLPNATRFAAALATCLARAPRNFWCFDAASPESEQRDYVVETIAHVGESAYRASPIYREVLQPLRLDLASELRALVCDGGSLLGWVGGLQDGPIRPAQRDRFVAILPALRRRLAADRVLRKQRVTSFALATALDHLHDAAFVLGARGEVEYVNNAGRRRLQLDRRATVESLASADSANGQIERVQLGSSPLTLVVLRQVAEMERCDGRVRRAADGWRLTPRQRQVLQLVIRGRGNASIAEELEIGERAVELHVSAILDRACVNSRASLVALVLGALVLG